MHRRLLLPNNQLRPQPHFSLLEEKHFFEVDLSFLLWSLSVGLAHPLSSGLSFPMGHRFRDAYSVWEVGEGRKDAVRGEGREVVQR